MPVLLLGGTGEARELAALLHPRTAIVSSLAGRVPDPALPVGPVRVGGFGGAAGLRDWLAGNAVTAVVDATHPFAATITASAAQACAELGLPHLVVHRPPWDPAGAIVVDSDVAAADVVADNRYSRVFLTTGRSGLRPFADSAAWYLIRLVTEPDRADLPRRHELVVSRGPYHADGERDLMRSRRVAALVTKNSGGELTRAKLDAAADLGVDVVMIARPPLPPGVAVVDSVAAAADWALSRGSAAG